VCVVGGAVRGGVLTRRRQRGAGARLRGVVGVHDAQQQGTVFGVVVGCRAVAEVQALQLRSKLMDIAWLSPVSSGHVPFSGSLRWALEDARTDYAGPRRRDQKGRRPMAGGSVADGPGSSSRSAWAWTSMMCWRSAATCSAASRRARSSASW
jgi:hypothetical protein